MAWGLTDDKLHSHRKTLRVPRSKRCEAMGLWTLVNSWCNDHGTDGAVPRDIWDEFGTTAEMAELLVTAGFWNTVPDGYQVVNWAEYNKTSAELDEKRAAEAERKRRWREEKARRAAEEKASSEDSPANVPAGQEGQSNEVPPESALTHTHTHTQTDTSNEVSVRPRKRGTRLREDWLPSEATRTWARENHPNVDLARAHEKFVNYWLSQSGQRAVKRDWDRTWRNWIISDSERAESTKQASNRGNTEQAVKGWLELETTDDTPKELR